VVVLLVFPSKIIDGPTPTAADVLERNLRAPDPTLFIGAAPLEVTTCNLEEGAVVPIPRQVLVQDTPR